MKANISLQGLNVADLVAGTSTEMPFNATSESSAYYNVTEPIVFILNATESLVDMSAYSSPSTAEPSTTTVASTTTAEPNCFQVMVDCSTLTTTTTQSTTTKTTPPEEVEEYEEDYGDDPAIRRRRQVVGGSSSPSLFNRTTPKSLTRLLDSLNSILRGLQQRNSSSVRPLPSTTTEATTTTTSTTTETPPSSDDER